MCNTYFTYIGVYAKVFFDHGRGYGQGSEFLSWMEIHRCLVQTS